MTKQEHRRPILAPTVGIAVAFAVGLGTSTACRSTRYDQNHCFNLDGDAACAEKYPDGTRPYCGVGVCFDGVADGCVETRPADDCYSPCGGRMSAEDEMSCVDIADTGDDSGTSGNDDTAADTAADTDGPGSTDDDAPSTDDGPTDTGPTGCTDHDQCTNPSQPFCDTTTGDCVDCSATPNPDDACNALDPDTPICQMDSGQCLACTAENIGSCDGNTPLCDTNNNTCIGCTQHDDCPDSACKIPMGVGTPNPDWGACFDTADVMDVPGDQVANAINAMGDELVLRVTNATTEDEVATVPAGANLAIIVMDGAPTWTPDPINGGPHITIADGASVWMDDMQLSGGDNAMEPAVLIEGGSLYARACQIVNNIGGGIEVTDEGRLSLDNSFVGGNINDVDGVNVPDGDARIRYSTIAVGGFDMSRALACLPGAAVEVHDSILATRTLGVPLDCASADPPDRTSIQDDLDVDWFENFAGGDFHLTGKVAHPFGGVAQWNEGDPLVDIDGNARSGVDGTSEVAGADLP